MLIYLVVFLEGTDCVIKEKPFLENVRDNHLISQKVLEFHLENLLQTWKTGNEGLSQNLWVFFQNNFIASLTAK